MKVVDTILTFIGLRHHATPIPEPRIDEAVIEAGKRNAIACRKVKRSAALSIMASAKTMHVASDIEALVRDMEREF